jgi:hypothetical protein
MEVNDFILNESVVSVTKVVKLSTSNESRGREKGSLTKTEGCDVEGWSREKYIVFSQLRSTGAPLHAVTGHSLVYPQRPLDRARICVKPSISRSIYFDNSPFLLVIAAISSRQHERLHV